MSWGVLPVWQDAAIALGSAVGLLTKFYALADTDTVWSRRSSVVNAAFYPPSLAAFASLGLWLTFTASCHGVSDAGVTGFYPIDDRAFDRRE